MPKHLLQRSSLWSSFYLARDILLAGTFLALATKIGWLADLVDPSGGWANRVVKVVGWGAYWWFQGLVGGGIFCLGICLISSFAKADR